jgi:hypothetical protein
LASPARGAPVEVASWGCEEEETVKKRGEEEEEKGKE